ncbi:MAG TPA: glycosyltransferase [Candidatus Angelobacter sp.]|nr:glycosyltransferase [Candidatus Angelobacter sp.]
MKIVIFGLTVSSSWGNGHATLWRGLIKALSRRGHDVTFFERDVPYYAKHRDLSELFGGRLALYSDWNEILPKARRQLRDADVGMVTSYCPDAINAAALVLESGTCSVFYDLDTPVTLNRLRAGQPVEYIGSRGLQDFGLVLSYTGGTALELLKTELGARQVAPLYGSVDPEVHKPVAPVKMFECDLSYLGTYAEDRQSVLQDLFIEPARRVPDRKFLIGGAQYPQEFPWAENIFFARHVAPPDHPAFYSSSQLTLNITRSAMAQMGYCPSGRLFEAAASGTPMISDWWEGLDEFFEPQSEILLSRAAEDVVNILGLSAAELKKISQAARERTLAQHTADHRAIDFETAVQNAWNHKSAVVSHHGTRSTEHEATLTSAN